MKGNLEKPAAQLVCVINSMNKDHKMTVKIIGLHHGVSDYLLYIDNNNSLCCFYFILLFNCQLQVGDGEILTLTHLINFHTHSMVLGNIG